MSTFDILYLSAALLALLYLGLTVQVIRMRLKHQVSLGEHKQGTVVGELQRAIRAHANFMEYVPLSLVLLFLLTQAAASAFMITLLCLFLVVGRGLHAAGILNPKFFRLRQAGLLLNLIVMAVSAFMLIGIAVL